jgi:hypothetical protein
LQGICAAALVFMMGIVCVRAAGFPSRRHAAADPGSGAGVEVLLEPSVGRNIRANPVVGRMSGAAALSALLQG